MGEDWPHARNGRQPPHVRVRFGGLYDTCLEFGNRVGEPCDLSAQHLEYRDQGVRKAGIATLQNLDQGGKTTAALGGDDAVLSHLTAQAVAELRMLSDQQVT